MTPQEEQILANFIRLARHVRNSPHPALPIEVLRSEATMAEHQAQYLLGDSEYEKICELAFYES